jgi:hypothetical protein
MFKGRRIFCQQKTKLVLSHDQVVSVKLTGRAKHPLIFVTAGGAMLAELRQA